MNRPTYVPLAIAIVFAVLICAGALWAPTDVHQGIITRIESTRIVLTSEVRETTFVINSATQITLNDKPAKVMELMPGDEAMVMAAATPAAAANDEPILALRIDAHRASSPGNPDPPEATR